MPQRVQRTRRPGQPGIPEGAKYVGRGTRWGNPARIGGWASAGTQWRTGDRCGISKDCLTQEEATLYYRMGLRYGGMVAEDRNGIRQAYPLPSYEDIRNELAGQDLACWCELPDPGEPDHCHAALLLLIANDYGAPDGAGICDRCWNWEGHPDTHPRCPDCGQPWNRRTSQ